MFVRKWTTGRTRTRNKETRNVGEKQEEEDEVRRSSWPRASTLVSVCFVNRDLFRHRDWQPWSVCRVGQQGLRRNRRRFPISMRGTEWIVWREDTLPLPPPPLPPLSSSSLSLVCKRHEPLLRTFIHVIALSEHEPVTKAAPHASRLLREREGEGGQKGFHSHSRIERFFSRDLLFLFRL